MHHTFRSTFILVGIVTGVGLGFSGLLEELVQQPADAREPAAETKKTDASLQQGHFRGNLLRGNLPGTPEEARGRAHLLYESFRGVLQVVHRDFYREDEGLAIPSQSLEDVFQELADSYGVSIRWLVVNAQAMNIDNKPEDEFERNAVKAISSGKESFELVTEKNYRYVGKIRLASQCLKCHLPDRKSTKARAAGLAISMPLQQPLQDPASSEKTR